MRILSERALKEYWEQIPEARGELEAWHAEARNADWKTPADIKDQYGSASILKGSRVVFNVCGNKYRLVVRINYDYGMIYIRFVGTHKEYDAIDAEIV
jgi:mRNA interferase HigB